jgi:imidazolonepropionase-like amidohydrolase
MKFTKFMTIFLITGFAASANADQTLFTNVNVFNGVDDELKKHDVLIEDNLIQRVGRNLDAPEGATVIDGGGRTLMPGLIDAHVHLNMLAGNSPAEMESANWDEIASAAAVAAMEYLESGVTTVRGMGSVAGLGLKKTIDKGYLPGPRIYPSGSYISQTSGHGDLLPSSQQLHPGRSNMIDLGIIDLVDGADEMRRAVRRNFARGASQIKIMVGGGISSVKGALAFAQFSDEEIRVAVEEAARRESYVAVHVYNDRDVRRVIELGVMSIEHGQFLSEETARIGKEKGVFFQGNLAGRSEQLLSHPYYGVDPIVRAKTLEFMESSSNYSEIMRTVQPKMGFQADCVLTADPVARKQLYDHEKWVWANEYGNLEALRSMTSVNGELMAMTGSSNPYPGKLGVVEEGAYADLLVVDGNPLEDITVIGANSKWFDAEPREGIVTIRVIMKDGKVYKNTLP